MTRDETIEAIKVMQAWVDGKTIQYVFEGKWVTLQGSPSWACDVKYRIKPEPREAYIVSFPKWAPSKPLLFQKREDAVAACSALGIPEAVAKFVEVLE